MRMRAVGKRITFFRRFARERLDVVDFKGEMSEIRPDHHRPALIELTNLDFFVAARSFKKDELRAAARRVPATFLQAEHVPIKGNGLFSIRNAATRVEELCVHFSLS